MHRIQNGMRRILTGIGVVSTLAVSATCAAAGTFTPAPLVPDLQLDALTQGLARQAFGRTLLSEPWATVTLSHIDVYDRFPYVESRHFLIVSDPAWNRLVYGEAGHALHAFDGSGTPTGALAAPRGLAVDDQDRVYVADAGHGRVLVLQASTTFDELTLTPVYAIDGLSDPHGVAWSDAGTPLEPGDDLLFVTDTGRNRVAAYALGSSSARALATIGTLGSGVGHFAGPLAITTGRDAGAATSDVYVADAHTRRLVRLAFNAGRFEWRGEVPAGADAISSLATDEWGNVYAAAPHDGVIRKFNAALEPVAELREGLTSPRALTIPFATVNDHRDGRIVRAGQASALVLEPWGESTGLRRFELGTSVEGLVVAGQAHPEASFTLTDRASIRYEIRDAANGRTLASREAGVWAAGHASITLADEAFAALPSATTLELVMTATPSYPGAAASMARTTFQATGSGIAPAATAALLPAWPNPARPGSRLRFSLPAESRGARLAVHDASGRRVRAFPGTYGAGVHEVAWDGLDDRGRGVRSGVYFIRLEGAGMKLSRRLVVVR